MHFLPEKILLPALSAFANFYNFGMMGTLYYWINLLAFWDYIDKETEVEGFLGGDRVWLSGEQCWWNYEETTGASSFTRPCHSSVSVLLYLGYARTLIHIYSCLNWMLRNLVNVSERIGPGSQLLRVQIGNHVEIGANSCIDRGRYAIYLFSYTWTTVQWVHMSCTAISICMKCYRLKRGKTQ